jgi:phosphatidylglycerol---prolipoprotein diacylglyceryl transferase
MSEGYWFGIFTPERIALDIGIIQVYWYSLIVTLSIVVAAVLARSRYVREGGSDTELTDLIFYAIISGIVGARLWHVFVFQWSYYHDHLTEIIKIWHGGIAIQGALLGGLVSVFFYCRSKKLPLLKTMDTLVIGIPLAQAIGRWGNFFNQELYGLPTKLPWGIFIDPENRVTGFESFSHFHPTFFYESALNVILFLFLWWYATKKRVPGRAVALYLVGYGLIRFIVDIVRIDPMLMLGSVRASQALCLLFVAGGATLWYLSRAQSVAK